MYRIRKRNEQKKGSGSTRNTNLRNGWGSLDRIGREREFLWLDFEEDWGVMFFKVCRDDVRGSDAGRKQNVFHTGCTNLKKCNVQKQRKGKITSMPWQRRCERQNLEHGKQEKWQRKSMNEQTAHKLKHRFQNAHAIARNCRPNYVAVS